MEHTSGALDPPPLSEREKKKLIYDNLINRFAKGPELYKNNSLFRQLIQILMREDVDSYQIIERLIEINEDQAIKIRKLLEQWPSHIPPNL